MTHFELYNEVKDMSDVEEIKKVVKRGLLEELAGSDFTIKESRKVEKKSTGTDVKKMISNEVFKRKGIFEKENGRKITDEEKSVIREAVEKEFNK